MRAARAGCTVVEHGALATQEAFNLLAEKGVWFDPNIGLVTQNYLENKQRFLGIGNYTEEGFDAMEKALGLKDAMFAMALKTPGLKMVMGTDAVAGAHGQNIRETLERVKIGSEADGCDRGPDVAGGRVDEPGKDDRHDRAGTGSRSRRRRRRSRSPTSRH